MKFIRVTVVVILLLFTIVKLTSWCNKKQILKLKTEFEQRLSGIEAARSEIFSNNSGNADSLNPDGKQLSFFNHRIDSGIAYYKDVYAGDEKRFGQYLKVLYQYKKLSYEFQALSNVVKDSSRKITVGSTYPQIQKNIREIILNLDSYRTAAMWEVFD